MTILNHTPKGRAREGKHAPQKLSLAHKSAIRKFVELVHVGGLNRLQ